MSGGKSASNRTPFQLWKLKMKIIHDSIKNCNMFYSKFLHPTWDNYQGISGTGNHRYLAYNYLDKCQEFSCSRLRYIGSEVNSTLIVSYKIKGLFYLDRMACGSPIKKTDAISYLRKYYTDGIRDIGSLEH